MRQRGWLSVPAEQITKELATVGEIAGVLDDGFRNHHRGMLRGCFEQAAALSFDHGVGGFPAHLVVVAAGPHVAIDPCALVFGCFGRLQGVGHAAESADQGRGGQNQR